MLAFKPNSLQQFQDHAPQPILPALQRQAQVLEALYVSWKLAQVCEFQQESLQWLSASPS